MNFQENSIQQSFITKLLSFIPQNDVIQHKIKIISSIISFTHLITFHDFLLHLSLYESNIAWREIAIIAVHITWNQTFNEFLSSVVMYKGDFNIYYFYGIIENILKTREQFEQMLKLHSNISKYLLNKTSNLPKEKIIQILDNILLLFRYNKNFVLIYKKVFKMIILYTLKNQ